MVPTLQCEGRNGDSIEVSFLRWLYMVILQSWFFIPSHSVSMQDLHAPRIGTETLSHAVVTVTNPNVSFVTSFEFEPVLPNNQKQLRQYLRWSGAPRYDIKCRRLPIDAPVTTRELPIGGDSPKVIFFLRLQGKAKIVVAYRLAPLIVLRQRASDWLSAGAGWPRRVTESTSQNMVPTFGLDHVVFPVLP
jgi:hypothetical protein